MRFIIHFISLKKNSFYFFNVFLDRIFHQSLSKFQHIRIYANSQVNSSKKKKSVPSCLILPDSVNDITVPFVTAAIEISDPFVDQEASGIRLYVQTPTL